MWSNLSSNNDGSLCGLLCVDESVIGYVLKICGLIRYTVIDGEMDMSILEDNWRLFIAECKLYDIEIETSKLLIPSKIYIYMENVSF